MDRALRLTLVASNPVEELARVIEGLLVIASAPLAVEELADACEEDAARVEEALALLAMPKQRRGQAAPKPGIVVGTDPSTGREVQLKEGENLNVKPLMELLDDLSKKYQITFLVMEDFLKADGVDPQTAKPKLNATQLRGLKLGNFLVGKAFALK